jgi:mono/diheme cytochrome c family protein
LLALESPQSLKELSTQPSNTGSAVSSQLCSSLRLLLSPVFTVFALSLAAAATAADSEFGAADMQQVVNNYCLACHSDALATGGFSLQSVDFTQPGEHADALERVVKKLRAHMMPPSGMPRPAFETYAVMTEWLEAELDQAWAANPNPGRVTPLHRMNRYEYNNTINDLLGIDVDVMDLLPGDPTADGSFDNIAAALPFTTAHMERYMSVAREVTRLATGLPPQGPTTSTYEIPLYMSQDWRQTEDMPFGSRGGVAVEHYFLSMVNTVSILRWKPTTRITSKGWVGRSFWRYVLMVACWSASALVAKHLGHLPP